MNRIEALNQINTITERFRSSSDKALTALARSSELVIFYNMLHTMKKVSDMIDDTLAMNKEVEAESKRMNERIERGFE